MLHRLRLILEMIRFSHTIFALPFALLAAVMAWALSAAEGHSWRWQDLIGILICMVAARSAAMAFNRIVDWKIDAANPRTEKRHIPQGSLAISSVVMFAVPMSVIFVAATLLFLPNRLPIYLSIPVLLILLGYSLTKRFTSLAHFWLGLALMLAPISAWIAIRGEILLANPADILPAVVLGTAVLLWVAGFDIIYACQDYQFDKQTGLHSVPTKLGVPNALRLAAVCHCGMIVALACLPFSNEALGLGAIYWCGIGAVAVLIIYEHMIVSPTDLERVNIAFFNVNAVVSLGLFAVSTVDILI